MLLQILGRREMRETIPNTNTEIMTAEEYRTIIAVNIFTPVSPDILSVIVIAGSTRASPRGHGETQSLRK